MEIWNLVFMESNRLDDGSLTALPKRNIDTGAGLERILPIVQGSSSVFDTDVLRRLIGSAEELTRSVYGRDEEDDVSLRILADHARPSRSCSPTASCHRTWSAAMCCGASSAAPSATASG